MAVFWRGFASFRAYSRMMKGECLHLETVTQDAPIPGYIEHLEAAGDTAPEFFTPREVAEILKVSTDTVLRKFSTVPGVIDLGNAESRKKRQYRTLRIPREVLERFIVESRIV